jgi:hypothetical protein
MSDRPLWLTVPCRRAYQRTWRLRGGGELVSLYAKERTTLSCLYHRETRAFETCTSLLIGGMTHANAGDYLKRQNDVRAGEIGIDGFIAKFAAHGAEAQLSCEGEGKVRQR